MDLQKKPVIASLVLIVGVLITPLFFGCGATKVSTQGVLRLRLSGEPSVLNPLLTTDASSSAVVSQIFSGLLRVNESLELEGNLATHWEVLNGGRRLVFHLRRDVKWHDGVPFTAKDVLFTFNAILDPKTNTVRRSDYIINGKPIQFSSPRPDTVVVDLPSPYAPILYRMAMEILPAHLLGNADINTASFNRRPIGTGPFRFVTWRPNQFIQLDAYSGYYLGTPALKTILFRVIPEYNVAKALLIKGDIDVLDGVSALDIAQLKKRPDLRVVTYDELLYSYMGFNLKNPHLSNRLVRQAVAHAIDRQAMIKMVLIGKGRVADLPVSPLSWASPSNPFHYAYQPTKSIQLLQEAGYRRNPAGDWVKNGSPLSFTILVSKGGKAGPKNAEIIQRYLKSVGIKVMIQQLEWQSFLSIITNKQDPKAFDMCILSWSLSPDPDAYSIWHSSQYPRGFNFVAYQNKRVDTLLEEARSTVHQPTRARIYHEAFRIIGEELPYLFLYYPSTITAYNHRLTGLSRPGPAGLFVRMEQVNAK